MLKQEKNQKIGRDKACLVRTKEARKRFLEAVHREFAKALFAKLLKKYPGTFSMKTVKGVWHLTFSYKNEKIKAQGKTLAHALIGLHSKSNCLTSKNAAL